MTTPGPGPTPVRSSFASILVVRQHDQLGDMLCAVPLLRALRENSPGAYITLVTSPVNHEIMLHHPYVDEVINYDKRRLLEGQYGLVATLQRLRSRTYDLAVVPATVSVSSTSNLIARLSGASTRIGPKSLEGKPNRTSWCFTRGIDMEWRDDPHRHQTLRNLTIVSELGIRTEDLTHRIGLTEVERNEARERLASLRSRHKLVVGFHPGAGKPPNRWSARNFAALIEHAASSLGAGILITQGPMDAEPVRELTAMITANHTLIREEPIRRVAALIDQLDAYVTNDTGLMHIAGGTSPRLLALFGPTDPLQWAPIGKKNRYLRGKENTMSSLTYDLVRDALTALAREI